MFAVVMFGGKQYRLREKDELDVETVDIEEGKNFKIDQVLLMGEEDGTNVKIGMPLVAGAHVECQVVKHDRADKIIVFKFQAKKRHMRRQGHRQNFTSIKVLKISAVEKKVPAHKEVVTEKAEPATVAKKAPAKKPAAKKATKAS